MNDQQNQVWAAPLAKDIASWQQFAVPTRFQRFEQYSKARGSSKTGLQQFFPRSKPCSLNIWISGPNITSTAHYGESQCMMLPPSICTVDHVNWRMQTPFSWSECPRLRRCRSTEQYVCPATWCQTLAAITTARYWKISYLSIDAPPRSSSSDALRRRRSFIWNTSEFPHIRCPICFPDNSCMHSASWLQRSPCDRGRVAPGGRVMVASVLVSRCNSSD
eukprot:SAG31_NODE_6343_length_2056_cov_1.130301_3_plen_219_part_00